MTYKQGCVPPIEGLLADTNPPRKITAATLLEEGARIYAERNAVYGDNFMRVAPIMAALFPDGAPPHVLHNHSFHLLELIVVKLSRFAISEMTHQDSIDDAAVYCAMIGANLKNKLALATNS
jgi:hypothetical protein